MVKNEWLRALGALAEDVASVPSTRDDSQPPIAPGPEDSTLSYDFQGQQACMWCTYIQVDKTLRHRIK